jgi:hypothetical protein
MQSKEKQQEHHTLGKYTIVLRIAFEMEATHGRSLVDFLPRIRKGRTDWFSDLRVPAEGTRATIASGAGVAPWMNVEPLRRTNWQKDLSTTLSITVKEVDGREKGEELNGPSHGRRWSVQLNYWIARLALR